MRIFEDEEDSFEEQALPQKRRIAFGWYGGKFSHLDWLLPLLPPCHHYCEPFSGSSAVLLNRYPSPVETLNDLDGDVVNFFRVLRDQPEALMRAIALTPFSREEYSKAILEPVEPLSEVERARRFYVKARQTRSGLAQSASPTKWAACKTYSSAGMSGAVSRWIKGPGSLGAIAERLLCVQIENRPAVDVIRAYDSRKTLFYCDPPYLHATRKDVATYKYEMTEEQHQSLADVLNACQGMVAVSGYDHPLMDEWYPKDRWIKTLSPEKTSYASPVRGKRVEVLWTNFDPFEHQRQMRLF